MPCERFSARNLCHAEAAFELRLVSSMTGLGLVSSHSCTDCLCIGLISLKTCLLATVETVQARPNFEGVNNLVTRANRVSDMMFVARHFLK